MKTKLSIFCINMLMVSCMLTKRASVSNELELNKIEIFLNLSIPNIDSFPASRFTHTSDGTLIGYSIYDLTDTTNVDKKLPDNNGPEINIVSGHFYHVSPILSSIAYSSIIYVDNKKFKIFKFINCPVQGDKINDVLMFASEKLKNRSDKVIIMNNISNYSRHSYHTYDDYASDLNCELIKK